MTDDRTATGRGARHVVIRPAAPADVRQVIALMRQLAEFEGHAASFTATPDRLAKGLFRAGGGLRCWVADGGGEVVGVALCATTWVGITSRPALRLLNLVVHPTARGAGIGLRLMTAVARACVELDCALDWMLRSDNVAAQTFYEGLGAAARPGWQPWQLSREGCHRLVENTEPPGPSAPQLPGGPQGTRE